MHISLYPSRTGTVFIEARNASQHNVIFEVVRKGSKSREGLLRGHLTGYLKLTTGTPMEDKRSTSYGHLELAFADRTHTQRMGKNVRQHRDSQRRRACRTWCVFPTTSFIS